MLSNTRRASQPRSGLRPPFLTIELVSKDTTNVFAVQIHPQHQSILQSTSGKLPMVAVKRFVPKDTDLFHQEREVLVALRTLHHPRVAELLATKISGLADAPFHIHNKGAHLSSAGIGDIPYQWACHRDIRPEHILLLADFGFSSFCRDSSNTGAISRPPGTRTYVSPETRLRREVGIKDDTWCFGCFILERLIWLYMGLSEVDQFADDRAIATPGSNLPLQDDHFVTLQYGRNSASVVAVVRSTVSEYVSRLYRNPLCAEVTIAVLNVVRDEMLVVDVDRRCDSMRLVSRFRTIEKMLSL
ncbi:kinase-like domain-containing protein [Aspergillus alliaceus]|uniref:kinase-like domain-containing protein n=1 Tax=Petromyces alliaceus TaxID=209559 RepID=UPI0012A6A5CA|nr:kinase-like domain-containing protein [Aspergillus alliaceus]KAB8229540.1 kinase-like domain-containing protein [Aspergillus alliaceus]